MVRSRRDNVPVIVCCPLANAFVDPNSETRGSPQRKAKTASGSAEPLLERELTRTNTAPSGRRSSRKVCELVANPVMDTKASARSLYSAKNAPLSVNYFGHRTCQILG